MALDERFSTISGGNMNRMARLLASTSVLVLAVAAVRAEPQYQVTAIGPVGPASQFSEELNQRGDVAFSGVPAGASYSHPYLYTAADGIRDLGLVPGARAGQPEALNDRGGVLIRYTMDDSSTRYFVNSGGTPHELVWPTPSSSFRPASLDNAGRIIGSYFTATGEQPFVLNGDTFTQLPIPDGLQGGAVESNAAGQIVGARWRHIPTFRPRMGESVARIWEPGGTVTEITPPAGWENTLATAINDHGDVLGRLFNGTIDLTQPPPRMRSFVYRDGVATELPAPPGWTELSAYAMNNNGDIVGTFYGPDGSYRLFLSSGGDYTDLSEVAPIANAVFPWAINDAGQILVHANPGRTFLLTPIPEPAAAAAMLSLLAATCLTRRRAAGGCNPRR